MSTSKSKTVEIKVRTVGQAFAMEASIIYRGRVIYTTREVPYGLGHLAYELAEQEAARRGLTVR